MTGITKINEPELSIQNYLKEECKIEFLTDPTNKCD
jgi:hypothetical protein